jgi:putative endonuclease
VNCAVYILASSRNGTLYIGVTSNLVKRVYEHKHEIADGFTKKYGVKMLVWFDVTTDITAAITREKQMKKWNRLWKLRLIEARNPEWLDLYADILA